MDQAAELIRCVEIEMPDDCENKNEHHKTEK
jgi:hypothetical protein